jgi:hypothetical protein
MTNYSFFSNIQIISFLELFPAVRYIFFSQKKEKKRMPLPSGLGIILVNNFWF